MPSIREIARRVRLMSAQLRCCLQFLCRFTTCTLGSIVVVILGLVVFVLGAAATVSCAALITIILVQQL